jgi:uncharacterized protein (TIGR02996 family)
MSDEAALWAAVAADPGDDTLRLAYADWLDERGDPRAAWFRSDEVWHHAKYHPAEVLNRAAARRTAPGRATARRVHRRPLAARLSRHANAPAGDRVGVRAAHPGVGGGRTARAVPAARGSARLPASVPAAGPRPVPELVRRVRRGGWFEQWLAVIDLGHHGPAAAKAVPALLRMRYHKVWDTADELYHDGRGAPVLLAYYHTLGCIGPAAAPAAPALAVDGWYNEAAYEALRKIRPDPLVVLKHTNDDNEWDALEGLRVVAEIDPRAPPRWSTRSAIATALSARPPCNCSTKWAATPRVRCRRSPVLWRRSAAATTTSRLRL